MHIYLCMHVCCACTCVVSGSLLTYSRPLLFAGSRSDDADD